MIKTKKIQFLVSRMFKGYDKNFVNELARLLILFGDDFKITVNTHTLSMFVAHVKAEVNRGKNGRVRMRESMNYKTSALTRIFKYFRHHPYLAKLYGRNSQHAANQKKIANIAYANRLGNRGIDSGDGWLYRGMGILQTTGRDNFVKDLKVIEEKTGIVLHGDDGLFHDEWGDNYTIGILFGFANWFRTKMYLSRTMDESTRIINYYTDSYRKRKKLYNSALSINKRFDNLRYS